MFFVLILIFLKNDSAIVYDCILNEYFFALIFLHSWQIVPNLQMIRLENLL